MAQKKNLLIVQITGAHESEDYTKKAGDRHSPEMVGRESSIRSITVCLHRGILQASLPPSSDLGCQAGPQPRASSNLAKVPLQSWDPISDTEPRVMLLVKHHPMYVLYCCVIYLIDF